MRPKPPKPLQLFQLLAEHDVEYIVVGGVAAVLNGAPITTFDIDIVHRRTQENIARLVVALTSIGAHYKDLTNRRLPPDPSLLALAGHNLLRSDLGDVDVLGTVSGERGYQELLPHSREIVAADLCVRVIDLPMLITLKEEANRDKDRAVLDVLRRTLLESRKA